MKQLKNHVLLFDEECPICRAYSGAFVKTGMLDKNGREAYQQMSNETCTLIDKEKARNEIALINTETGGVYYGIDSLFTIIANNYSFLKPLFNFQLFRWFMKKVYSFISYNRKVIIPGKKQSDSCVPDFNIKYRLAYLFFTWVITSFILTKYSTTLTGIIPESKFFREFFICGGQIAFQTIVISIIAKEKILEYLGNMMTISFAASLLLILFYSIAKLLQITNPILFTAFFMLVVALMFLDHIRRMKLIGVHWFVSISWVIYRIIILTFIV